MTKVGCKPLFFLILNTLAYKSQSLNNLLQKDSVVKSNKRTLVSEITIVTGDTYDLTRDV